MSRGLGDVYKRQPKGSFTITDNVAVLGSEFVVDGVTITEGVDFVAGIDVNETASNLSAAISLISNISSTSDGAVANIQSEVSAVNIPISVTGGGATASGTELAAPTANAGELTIKSEVKEGDSLIVGSNFNSLNQGIFRVIRKFNNSISVSYTHLTLPTICSV